MTTHSTTQPRSKPAPGFTLIEMLVVISIIALLISILLPSLQKAKESARQSNCLSNIRQFAVAWQSYTTESMGEIFDYTLNRADRKLWTTVLQPYYGNDPQLLICQSTDDPPGSTGVGDAGIPGVRFGNARRAWVEARPGYNAPHPYNRSSYCYNGNMFSASTYNTSENRYRKVTMIVTPGNAPILGDGTWRSATPGVLGTGKVFPSNLYDPESSAGGADDSVYRWVTNRHGNVSQIAFADSHASAIPLQKMWSLKWHRNYVTVETMP